MRGPGLAIFFYQRDAGLSATWVTLRCEEGAARLGTTAEIQMQIPRTLRLRSGQANSPRKRGCGRLGMTMGKLSGAAQAAPCQNDLKVSLLLTDL